MMSSQSKALPLYLSGGILLLGILPLVVWWPSFSQPLAPECLLVRDVGQITQWAVVITAFGVKPAYMVLSLIWIAWLWRRRASDLVALRWGLLFFLAGEIACAANYIVFGGNSAVTDYLHSYGMAVGFSFVAYSALEGMDVRLVKYTPAKDRCAALSLCRSCIKYAEVPCGLRRLFLFLIPALVVISLMLLCVELKPLSLRTNILNSTQDFPSPLWSQIFEGRYCAWLAISLLLISWGTLWFMRKDAVATAKIFFAAAMGPLGFGMMRLFLRAAYRDNLAWANIWEELTELVFVAGVGLVLWLFRGSLFREELLAPAEEADSAKAPVSATE